MSGAKLIEGQLTLEKGAKIAVLCSRFNGFIVDQLEAGCLDTLRRHGVLEKDVTIIRVPGAFEMPVIAKKVAQSGSYEVIIGLGAVIRGGTAHFDHVAGTCSRGLATVATDTGVPIVFGVLTVDSIEQAVERAGTKAGNKGADAAATAIEMISLVRQL
ncbi:MAG: 6,7-dimethyl-8-ribityllumazine synthase [Gammaproteobacteria bacterium]|jgi:6,7-dimethyl-8-ribityllumazine synthase|nr:6,7-dimethyl-8-ribityllumazine synthase [Gammaproteobacteria bacterium]HJP35309.1 6,7-dimethyl-8-ribityllumazine synthase [Gammaproteobacteria bacterium]